MLTPQTSRTKTILYVLVGLGFAGLIAAHELAPADAAANNASMTLPFILAAAGTLCFVAAGLMARRLMKQARRGD